MRLVFAFLLLFCSGEFIFSQSNYSDSLIQTRKEKEEHLLDSTTRMLNSEDLKHFKSLHYFHVDTSYRMNAVFVKNVGKRFKMPTSTEREPVYRRYGYVYFNVDNKSCTLTVYQNMELRKKPEFKNYFFIPFRDETSGKYTYGGGRYLDVDIFKNQTTILLDFNLCYNPYCAYSRRYSCPIPPKENTLNVSIIAGEKTPIYFD